MEYIPRDFAHAVFINRTSLSSQLPSFISDADVIVYEFVERRSDCLIPDLTSLSSIMD